MEYPEEIYKTRDGGSLAPEMRSSIFNVAWGRRHAYKVGHEAGYAEGLAKGLAEQSDPLAGYSNLTAAIKAGEPIDWELLDGLKVKCVNRYVGTLRGVLMRNRRLKPDTSDAWWDEEATASYINALYDGWSGKDGWTLWVKGEIPLRRKTADQLPVGHFFTGKILDSQSTPILLCVGLTERMKAVVDGTYFMDSYVPASDWEVIADHGPFQKPEGE